LGASTHITAGDVRWLSPLPLWAGILAGPLAWAFDLQTTYALVHRACATQDVLLLRGITVVSLACVGAGSVAAWNALSRTANDVPSAGGLPRQRARFMAILGLSMCAFSALAIVALALPRWMLNACQ
jgi:hypothetical protein